MEIVKSLKAPGAVGPYSQAVISHGQVFLSGMLPLNPETGQIVGETVEEQSKQVMENIIALLEDVGLQLEDVVKTTIFLDSMEDFQKMNQIYGEYFTSHKPARSCVEVAAIPKAALVEIEVLAHLK
ncbi:RidA family protein [Rossellomorea sp. NS-SX7]|uniref:RidA family protein n=1 Tax=Rossellomorea sp. NS-SX7 TaxID=3463856 RepID=UPI00405890AF